MCGSAKKTLIGEPQQIKQLKLTGYQGGKAVNVEMLVWNFLLFFGLSSGFRRIHESKPKPWPEEKLDKTFKQLKLAFI